MAEHKRRAKKCELCTASVQKATDCLPCQQQAVMQAKVEKVMHEFKNHTLHAHSSDGPIVESQKQAVAIALSQGRKAAKVKQVKVFKK